MAVALQLLTYLLFMAAGFEIAADHTLIPFLLSALGGLTSGLRDIQRDRRLHRKLTNGRCG